MADITRDSFNATASRVELIFQRDRNVLDAELNEVQQIRTHEAYRRSVSHGAEEGVSTQGFNVVGSGLNYDVTIQPGYYTVQGHTYGIGAPTLLSSLMGVAAPLPKRGVSQAEYIYIDFQLVEVDAAADPSIAVAALGETTRRKVLRATWGVSELTVGTPTGAGDLFAGGVVRRVIASVWRNAGQDAVPAEAVTNQAQVGLAAKAHFEANAVMRLHGAQVTWDQSSSTLSIRDEQNTSNANAGLLVTMPGGMTTLVRGQFVLADGQALYLNAKHFGNVDRMATGLPVYTAPGVTASDPMSPTTVDTIGLDRGIPLAIRLGATVVLRGGRVIRPTGAGEVRSYGSWAANDNRRERLEVFVGSDSAEGDFNGPDALLRALALIPYFDGVGLEYVIRLRGGLHTLATPSASQMHLFEYDTNGSYYPNLRVSIIGEGSLGRQTSVECDTTNIVGSVFRFAAPTAMLHLHLEGFAFYDVASSDTVPLLRAECLHLSMRDMEVTGLVEAHADDNGSVRFVDCVFNGPLGPHGSAAVSAFGSPTYETAFSAERCDFYVQDVGGEGGLSIRGFRSILVADSYFRCATAVDSARCLYVGSHSLGGPPEHVVIRENRFAQNSRAGGRPIRVSAGRRIHVHHNQIASATFGAVGWAAQPFVHVEWERDGNPIYVCEEVRIEDNTISVGYVDGSSLNGGVITVRPGATVGIQNVKALSISRNTISGQTNLQTTMPFVGVYVAPSDDGGDRRIFSGQIKDNTILVDISHRSNFLGVSLGNNSVFNPLTNDFQNFDVSGNTFQSEQSAFASGVVVEGVRIRPPFRNVRVRGNSFRLCATGLGATSDSTCVTALVDVRDVLIADNYMEAEFPVDISAINLYAYVVGNHTVRCGTTNASRGGTGATSTFNVADNKTS